MKKKISLSTMLTLILLTMALTISLTMLLAMRHFNNQLQLVGERQAMYTHINDVDKKVREYYPDLDEDALRQGITQHLRRHMHVASSRLGVYGEGESGVTIVTLK